jgi:hypothetical protein
MKPESIGLSQNNLVLGSTPENMLPCQGEASGIRSAEKELDKMFVSSKSLPIRKVRI